MAKKPDTKSAAAFGAQGGKQRASNLTKEERRAIALQAAEARWGTSPVPRALRTAKLGIAGIEFDCAVLDDQSHTRVVSETKFMAAMGIYRSGAVSTRRRAPIPL